MHFKILLLIFFLATADLPLYGNAPAEMTAQPYDNDFIALLEMVYGEGLLSQGGIHSIEEMFSGVDLDDLKLLDLGSGLGMYDIYLAQKHDTEIVGVDPQETLIQQANFNLEKSRNGLKGTISFLQMQNPNNLNEFSDNLFDIVFSKEAILHVPHEIKETYFQEIHRVLKPGGKIIIMDWMHSSPNYSPNTQKMMEMDGLVFQLSSPNEYAHILEKAGFYHIELIDTTLQHAQFSQENIDTILSNEERIIDRFGENTYHYSLESWSYQRDAFIARELLTGIFKAYKPM